VFMGVIFLLLPAIWVFFYNSRHVKATCEQRDPVRRWTDACPLPVLAVSLWTAFGAVTMVLMGLLMPAVLPFFGMFLTGWAGKIVILVLAIFWGYCAWALYRLDLRGWWLLVAGVCVFTVSHVLTYSQQDIMEMYRLMGYPEAQMAEIQKFNFISNKVMAWGILLWMLPMLGYLAWVKKFFRRGA